MRLILASASPRRAQVLRNAGIEFEARLAQDAPSGHPAFGFGHLSRIDEQRDLREFKAISFGLVEPLTVTAQREVGRDACRQRLRRKAAQWHRWQQHRDRHSRLG